MEFAPETWHNLLERARADADLFYEETPDAADGDAGAAAENKWPEAAASLGLDPNIEVFAIRYLDEFEAHVGRHRYARPLASLRRGVAPELEPDEIETEPSRR
jgi:hypothetical protein